MVAKVAEGAFHFEEADAGEDVCVLFVVSNDVVDVPLILVDEEGEDGFFVGGEGEVLGGFGGLDGVVPTEVLDDLLAAEGGDGFVFGDEVVGAF